jgi:hypothetical protein
MFSLFRLTSGCLAWRRIALVESIAPWLKRSDDK